MVFIEGEEPWKRSSFGFFLNKCNFLEYMGHMLGEEQNGGNGENTKTKMRKKHLVRTPTNPTERNYFMLFLKNKVPVI